MNRLVGEAIVDDGLICAASVTQNWPFVNHAVVGLKMGSFKPEYSGKMNFYINAVDDLLRHTDDKPTIGIILCKSKNKAIAEYSLRQTEAPLAIATHKLPPPLKNKMPTPAALEKEMDTAIKRLKENEKD